MNRILASIILSLLLYTPSSAGLFDAERLDNETGEHGAIIKMAQRHRKGDLKFIRSEAGTSKDGKFFHITGAVKNVTESTTLKKVTITIQIYDRNEEVLFEKTVPALPDTLKAGEEGTFEVITEFSEKMHGYRKSVTWKTSRWQ